MTKCKRALNFINFQTLSTDGKASTRSLSRDTSKIYAHGYDIFRGVNNNNNNKNGNYYGAACDIGGSGDSGQADYYYREHIAAHGVEEAAAGNTQLENNIAELLGNETRYCSMKSDHLSRILILFYIFY